MLFKNKTEECKKDTGNAEDKVTLNQQLPQFHFGVQDTWVIEDSLDLMVVGRLNGNLKENDATFITNLGDDHQPITVSVVKEIEVGKKKQTSASNNFVTLRIEGGKQLPIKIGTVLFSRNTTQKEIHDAYLEALYGGYIDLRKMQISQQICEQMSLTDLAELRRLYAVVQRQQRDRDTKEGQEHTKQILDQLAAYMCDKILNSDEIYTVVNKHTGEPHMFSQVFEQAGAGYVTSPPDILLITKAYLEVWKQSFPEETFEIIRIEKGLDGKGIYNFLGNSFYINGACGVRVLFQDFAIDASMLVKAPDYENTPKIQVPVTNPDLERWLLLIGQQQGATGEKNEKILSIFYGHLLRELPKAKFLIPMKFEGEMEKPDENGNAILKKDSQFSFPTKEGKKGRESVPVFTDWKRFHMAFPEEEGWEGLVNKLSELIQRFDCAINPTQYIAAGCYIDLELYQQDIQPFEPKSE